MSNVLSHTKSLEFILGGNSTFTFLNTITGNRFTFRVKRKKDNLFYVKALTGSSEYSYIGSILNNNFRHSIKSRISVDSQSVKVFHYVFHKLINSKLDDCVQIWHDGKCGRCNRQLTVPESIESGFGPECVKLIKQT